MLTAMQDGGGVESTEYNSTLLLSCFLVTKAVELNVCLTDSGVKSDQPDHWGSWVYRCTD